MRFPPSVVWRKANMNTKMSHDLSKWFFLGGIASILTSLLVWPWSQGDAPAHGERFSLFIGLWAPTFCLLSERFARLAAGRREYAYLNTEAEETSKNAMGEIL